jgi:hypothetical protein
MYGRPKKDQLFKFLLAFLIFILFYMSFSDFLFSIFHFLLLQKNAYISEMHKHFVSYVFFHIHEHYVYATTTLL